MIRYRNSDIVDVRPAKWSIFEACCVFLPAFLLFCVGAVTDITVPGIYMDAVNPDYIIVRLLNPAAVHTLIWALPGVVLFGRFPLLGQIYHGALPFYVGLPFYALFGTGVVGVRLTNMVFGLAVIAGAGAFLWATGVRALICCLCLMLLALDPGFLFSFRTQFYITLLPIAATFASVALVECSPRVPPRWSVFLAGFLAGLSCYGYFIFGFLVPAVALVTFYRWGRLPKALLWLWPFGFLIGISPYALGAIGMLIATGSPHAFISFLVRYLHTLQVQSSPLSLTQRVKFFFYLLQGTALDVGPSSMMLHALTPLEMPNWKLDLLLLVPSVAFLSGIGRPRRIVGLLAVLGMLLGFLGLVLAFGGRLWFHHAALLLPLLYVGLALGLERIAQFALASRPRSAGLACAFLLTPFLIANASDRQAVFLQLETTGGVGLASDAIDRFAQDALLQTSNVQVFFPDWGAFMQFAMLTRGAIPYSTDFSPATARATLCGGTNVEVVTMASHPPERLEQWIAAIGQPSETKTYKQRDGTPVFFVTRWKAIDRATRDCTSNLPAS